MLLVLLRRVAEGVGHRAGRLVDLHDLAKPRRGVRLAAVGHLAVLANLEALLLLPELDGGVLGLKVLHELGAHVPVVVLHHGLLGSHCLRHLRGPEHAAMVGTLLVRGRGPPHPDLRGRTRESTRQPRTGGWGQCSGREGGKTHPSNCLCLRLGMLLLRATSGGRGPLQLPPLPGRADSRHHRLVRALECPAVGGNPVTDSTAQLNLLLGIRRGQRDGRRVLGGSQTRENVAGGRWSSIHLARIAVDEAGRSHGRSPRISFTTTQVGRIPVPPNPCFDPWSGDPAFPVRGVLVLRIVIVVGASR